MHATKTHQHKNIYRDEEEVKAWGMWCEESYVQSFGLET
jgi:hypothetical protein